MSDDEGKSKDFHYQQPQAHYGTFQPPVGFPQPAPPPGSFAPPSSTSYYPQGYQTVPVYSGIAEGTPVVFGRQRRLPCCGIGLGWFLFIIGFFLASVPWYVGAFFLIFARVDPREKPGYVACTIAAVVAAIAVILGVTKGVDDW